MTTLAQVRDGLEARLNTITGLRVHDHVPGDITPPAAIILPPLILDYREDLGLGAMRATFPVMLLVSSTLARQQLDLYELIERSGPRSIFAVIEADRTLGGLNVDAHAVNVEPADLDQLGLANYYARAVNIDVFVS